MIGNTKEASKKAPLISWILSLIFVLSALIVLYLNLFIVRYEAVDTSNIVYQIVYQNNGKEVGTLIELLVFPAPWLGVFMYLALGILSGMPILKHYLKAHELDFFLVMLSLVLFATWVFLGGLDGGIFGFERLLWQSLWR